MSEVPGYLYALRDEAGKAAENLRRCAALVERELAYVEEMGEDEES